MGWDFPAPAVLTDVSNSNVGAASAIAGTLPATPGRTNYLAGFEVTGSGATVGLVITVTVTGVVGGPLSYVLPVVAGALLGNGPLVITFPRPIPATGPNVAIAVSVPSFGLGNTNAAVTAHGYMI
jgi:hypothetical protein